MRRILWLTEPITARDKEVECCGLFDSPTFVLAIVDSDKSLYSLIGILFASNDTTQNPILCIFDCLVLVAPCILIDSVCVFHKHPDLFWTYNVLIKPFMHFYSE